MKEKIIFHLDVNSAYLSFEAAHRLQRGDNLDLREVSSVIGGDPKTRHGIILAKSIPAKKHGIKTGESIYLACKKCPELIIVPPNYSLYMKCSNAFVNILKEYSPLVERFSIDECWLDYTGMDIHFGDPIKAAYEIKERIKTELGFTINIGIGNSKLLSKQASEFEKPDKVHTLFKYEIREKMWSLPIEELFGVGRATAPKFRKMGINTIGDLANYNFEYIKYKFKSHGELIWRYANRIDDSPVRTDNHSNMKGLSNSTTRSFDVTNKQDAFMVLLSLVETVAMRLRDAGSLCGVISVSLKNSDFIRYSHQKKLLSSTDSTTEIYNVVKQIFNEMWKRETIRQLGVRVTDISQNIYYQKTFFDEENKEKNKQIDKAMDGIRQKFGSKSVVRASFLHSGIKPLTGEVISDEEYPIMSSIL
nr:DNA polymerase IV [Tepidibacter aestuarii]